MNWVAGIGVAVAIAGLGYVAVFGRPVTTFEWQGTTVRTAKYYFDYDDYKNDPNNLRPEEAKRIAALLREVPPPTGWTGKNEFYKWLFDLKVPGYGLGAVPAISYRERQFQVSIVEVPKANEARYLTYEVRSDGAVRVLDDAVLPTLSVLKLHSVSDMLVLIGRDGDILRRINVAGL